MTLVIQASVTRSQPIRSTVGYVVLRPAVHVLLASPYRQQFAHTPPCPTYASSDPPPQSWCTAGVASRSVSSIASHSHDAPSAAHTCWVHAHTHTLAHTPLPSSPVPPSRLRPSRAAPALSVAVTSTIHTCNHPPAHPVARSTYTARSSASYTSSRAWRCLSPVRARVAFALSTPFASCGA